MPRNGLKPNQMRHAQNLSLADGIFYHGIYYEKGVPRNPEAREKKLPRRGTIVAFK